MDRNERGAAARVVAGDEVAALAEEARAAPRRRSHRLLHDGHGDAVQRLLIMADPGTYVRPHRHSEQWELLALLQGRARLLLFAPDGALAEAVEMSPQAARMVEIAPGTAHGFVALEPGTLVLEIKPGPYRPNEFLDWAPAEGEAGAEAFVAWAARAEAGAGWQP